MRPLPSASLRYFFRLCALCAPTSVPSVLNLCPSLLSKSPNLDRHCSGGTNNRYNPNRRVLMQYLLMLYANEAGWSNMTKTQQEQGYAAYMAYTEALKKAGAWVGSNRLQPIGTATTVRVTDGKSQVLDGPYIDSKEQLGGYYLIDVPDLDT